MAKMNFSDWSLKLTGSWLLTTICLLTMPNFVAAATTEFAVKAGFIYNFSKYIEWPANAVESNSYHLCVIGEDKREDSLDVLVGKLVGNKPLTLTRNVKPANLKDCHMLFVIEDNNVHAEALLTEIAALPIVTISDSPDFILKGGMIGLIRDGNRVGFEVNLKPANAVGIRMSVQLLKLAKSVRGLK